MLMGRAMGVWAAAARAAAQQKQRSTALAIATTLSDTGHNKYTLEMSALVEYGLLDQRVVRITALQLHVQV